MSQQLQYLSDTLDILQAIRLQNKRFHTDAKDAMNGFPELEIHNTLAYAKRIDQMLAVEMQQVREAYERTKAELEATQPDPTEDMENCFDSFITHCLTNFEDRRDLVADGSTVTFSVEREGPDGIQQFSITSQDGSIEATTRTDTA